MFPDETREIEDLEYYKSGKYLAEYLATRLVHQGINVADVGAEDWGWYVELGGDYGLIQVGCAKVDDSMDQWLIHTHESKGIEKWFSRLKGKVGLESEVIRILANILQNEPRFRNAGWIDDDGRNWSALSSDPSAPLGVNDVDPGEEPSTRSGSSG
jgi:hypothetical protein